ncbi:LiaI-LiaF-like domain-containing protein [Salmonirosea aquatica]|uniref:LiaI-LiaF-like transmembrane region domain-containing protein n=1 Tax=Salmonirosea aquatica TaxID=2654236 RepID=A0A7C9BI10_9BACT|nr:hypothetical protein [Cytophagaceae bacterium SJW1-29]
MKRSNGIFWGGLLVVLGVFWMLRNLGFLHVDWHEVSRFWPALLILAGIGLLASRGERGSVGRGISGILIVLAVLAGITHRTERSLDRHRDNWNFRWDDDDDDRHDDDEWDFGDRKRERDRGYDDDDESSRDEDSDSEKIDVQNGHYEYDMENNLREATLNFEGGAGDFKLKGDTDKLFEADTRSSVGEFTANIRNNRNANTAVIDFKMENNHVELKNGKMENDVEINLNENPIWNIDMGVGAGKANFDLSAYKVKSLKVSTGVADLELRLGDKVPQADVEIESGVASVTLEIPESVGYEVRIDGALNVKDMDDLVKVNDNLYRSADFDSATRRVAIRYDAGLSKVKIRRY